MKRIIVLSLLLMLAFAPVQSYAAFGYKSAGSPIGTVTDLNVGSGYQSFDGSTLTIGFMGMIGGGVSKMSSAPTAIPLGYDIVRITGASQSCTLANGTAGQVLTLICVDYTGTVTITPATSTGWKSATLGANGQTLTLLYYNSTYGWIVIGYNGATVNLINSM